MDSFARTAALPRIVISRLVQYIVIVDDSKQEVNLLRKQLHELQLELALARCAPEQVGKESAAAIVEQLGEVPQELAGDCQNE